MQKLILLDAYAIIYRAYYAFIRNPRINSKKLNTSAIFGFVNTLEEIIKKEQPTHLAVAFDPAGKTFRHEEYPAYKEQRESTPEDIKISVPIIKQIIEAYNIPIMEVPGYEADDVIGTLAKQAAKQAIDVYMVTPDKDYAQLVSEHIFMYRPKHTGGYEVMGVDEIKEKYSIDRQEQVIDLLGLMGDKSDNIPGCPGVGEKTAVKLLNQFGTIENLLENTEQLKGTLKKKVEENREQIIFSKYLVTIKTDVPIEFDLDRLRVEQKNESVLREIFDDLEFNALATRIFKSTADKAVSKKSNVLQQNGQMSLFDDNLGDDNMTVLDECSGYKTIQNSEHKYLLVDTRNKREELLKKLMQQSSVCFDTETTGVDVFTAEMVGFSFCFKEGEAYYVPLPVDGKEQQSIIDEFKVFLENESIEKIAQNIKFDLLMLRQYGVEMKGKLFDTMIAHYLIQPELRHGMDYLAEIYLKYKTIHYQKLVGPAGKKQKSIRCVDVELLKDYASEDADVTFQLKQILQKELQTNDLEKLFYEIEMPLMEVLAKMEQNGVLIDSNVLKESSEILTKKLFVLEQEIHKMAGVEFNVGSPMQVGEVLFDNLKLDNTAKKTKSGQYSTSEDILRKLRSKHPIVDKILDFRGLKKLLSTYIDALPQMVNPKTGKIHTSYNQTVVATGRLSSTNPNLQNIPVQNEQGREIRKVFIPRKEELFLSADYSQIELRIMAHLSGDQNMIDAFISGYDIHVATAANIFKVPIEDVTADMRRKAKTANFGIIYGISNFGLAERLSIPYGEAKKLIEDYFATYSGVRKYMDEAIRNAQDKEYVETIYGRKRFLLDINSKNRVVRGFAERNAINAPIQGAAADIIKLAMINIQKKIEKDEFKSRMTMQVHDELNFTVPRDEIELMREMVVNEMEHVVELKVPLVAESGIGDNWLEAH